MRKIKAYFIESYNELIHKVSWPAWPELQGSAIVVMVAALIISIIIFGMDISFRTIMNLIYGMFFN